MFNVKCQTSCTAQVVHPIMSFQVVKAGLVRAINVWKKRFAFALFWFQFILCYRKYNWYNHIEYDQFKLCQYIQVSFLKILGIVRIQFLLRSNIIQILCDIALGSNITSPPMLSHPVKNGFPLPIREWHHLWRFPCNKKKITRRYYVLQNIFTLLSKLNSIRYLTY